MIKDIPARLVETKAEATAQEERLAELRVERRELMRNADNLKRQGGAEIVPESGFLRIEIPEDEPGVADFYNPGYDLVSTQTIADLERGSPDVAKALREAFQQRHGIWVRQGARSFINGLTLDKALTTSMLRRSALYAQAGEVKRREGELGKNSEQIGRLRDAARARAELLERAVSLEGMPLICEKREYLGQKGGIYSLWIANSPVLRYEAGGSCRMLQAKRRDAPMRLVPISLGQKARETARGVFEIVNGDFCDACGIGLYGRAEEESRGLFQRVTDGVEILPSACAETSLQAVCSENGARSNRETERVMPRTWGQEYIAKFNPREIVEGELRGSGGYYRGFVFEKIIAVEFSQDEAATYFFERERFEELRATPRTQLLESRPAGFLGRVVHTQNRDTWREAVFDKLTKD